MSLQILWRIIIMCFYNIFYERSDNMKTIYLVTGAAGHLGNTVVKKLIENGKKVRALVLLNDKFADQLDKKVDVYVGNVCDKKTLESFFTVEKGTDIIVIHCAGIVSIGSAFKQIVYDVNVNGTKNVVDMCRSHNVKKLIYVSSVHSIPVLEKDKVIKEIIKFDSKKVEGLYAKTKSEATSIVLNATKKGLNASVVQPSGIVGPYDYGSGHMTQLFIDYYKGRIPAGIFGGYDFVDVRDVAAGIISCISKGKSGECYILSNRYYSVSEILNIFHNISGKKKIKIFFPMWVAKIFAPISELYCKIVHKTPLYTAYSLYTLTSNSDFSHEKADKELNYITRPFENTVADTFEWLKAQKRI